MKRLLLRSLLLSHFCSRRRPSRRSRPATKGTPIAERRRPRRLGGPPATLKIRNRPIVTLRGTLLGYTPKQRVEAAELRINAVIERGTWGAVTTKTTPGGLLIQIGEQWDVRDHSGRPRSAGRRNARRRQHRGPSETSRRPSGRSRSPAGPKHSFAVSATPLRRRSSFFSCWRGSGGLTGG